MFFSGLTHGAGSKLFSYRSHLLRAQIPAVLSYGTLRKQELALAAGTPSLCRAVEGLTSVCNPENHQHFPAPLSPPQTQSCRPSTKLRHTETVLPHTRERDTFKGCRGGLGSTKKSICLGCIVAQALCSGSLIFPRWLLLLCR